MKKLGNILYCIFSALFILLPLLILSKSDHKLSQLEHYSACYFIVFAVVAVGLVFFLFTRFDKHPDWLLASVPTALSAVFRYLCYKLVGQFMAMKYDYLTALESARGVFASKEALFTAWGFYPRVLAAWFRITGNDSLACAVAFNIIVSAVSVALIYFVARKVFDDKRIGLAASLLFAFWPSYGLYVGITSTEHLAIMNYLLASYLLICAWQSEGKRRWIFVCAAGIAAGVCDCFKEFTPVFIIAAAAAGLVFCLINKVGAKKFLSLALALVLMFGLASDTHSLALKYLESYLGQPVAKSATGHFLWVGLNSRSGGMWSSEVGMKVYELAEEYDNDYERVNAELLDMLKADLAAHPESLRPTIEHKMEVDWAADTGVTDWIRSLYTGDHIPKKDWIYMGSGAYYMALIFLMLVGAVFAFTEKNKKPEAMFFRLICFGYALLFVLSEAQGRYQMVLFPFFTLLAAEGAKESADLLKRLLHRREKT